MNMRKTTPRPWKIVKMIFKYSMIIMAISFVGGMIYYWPQITHLAQWNPILTPLWANNKASIHEDTSKARLADLDVFEYLVELDRSFTPEQRALFLTSLDEVRNNVNAFTQAQFIAEIYRMAALSGNGHTGASYFSLMSEIPQVPVQFYWFGTELRIVRTHKKHQEIIGGHVLAINDIPVNDLFEELRPYLTGIENHERIASTVLLARPFFLAGAGLVKDENSLSLTLEVDQDENRNINLIADHMASDPKSPARYPWDYLTSEAVEEENGNWISVGSQWKEVPYYLSDYTKLHDLKLLQDGTALHVRLRLCMSRNGYDLEKFWAKIGSTIDRGGIDKIIFDYRYNPGGDLTQSRDFLTDLSNRLDAGIEVFILTNSSTFSAAIVAVSEIKSNKDLKVTHIGEPVGDSDTFWAETGLPLRLPNTGIRINYSTGYHDWVKGCAGQPYCYTAAQIEIDVKSLNPEIPVPLSFEDYQNGTDPILTFILNK